MSDTFEDFLRGHGFIVNGFVPADGRIHRFQSADKRKSGDKPLWAIRFDEHAGYCGNWRSDERHYWQSEQSKSTPFTHEQINAIEQKRNTALAQLESEREQLAAENLRAWNAIEHVGGSCEYLITKGVANYGLKIDPQGNAFCPMRDINGKLWNYQNISVSPKKFARGKVGGCFHIIPGDESRTILASGYATGASVHAATGNRVVVCGGDSNMLSVARILQNAGWKNLLAACDNDMGGSESGNKTAERIRSELGIACVLPDSPGDFNDHAVEYGHNIYRYFHSTTPAFRLTDYWDDRSPMPEDVIAPRILTEGGMLVFGGAPKVGKSDFMLAWLMHMAAGLPFMEMTPPRPLRIFYLQAEVQYHYLRERIQEVNIDPSHIGVIGQNLVITPQTRLIMDEHGVQIIGNTIRQFFPHEAPDIIAIDPISNVYDQESENDNAMMMKFLSQRVEGLRSYASEKTSFILVHHTKKVAKDELAKDAFQMFSGASSLRRYYTTGMVMYRPDEEVSECVLQYEVRNGPRVPTIHVDKDFGRWVVVPKDSSRIAKKDEFDPRVFEKEEAFTTITELLANEWDNGITHTRESFSGKFADAYGLGSQGKIKRTLNEMIAKGKVHQLDDKKKIIRASLN